MARELIEQYRKNKVEIARLASWSEQEQENYSTRDNEILGFYNTKMRKLDDRRDNEISSNEKEWAQFREVMDERVQILSEPLKKVRRIINFLECAAEREDITIDDEKLKPTRGYQDFFEPLGFLIDDEFLKVKLFIFENRRPKNKYTLAAIGKCAFPESLTEWRKHYGNDFSTYQIGRAEVEETLFVAPTVEAIKERLEKDRDRYVTRCKQNYDDVKTEYLETSENYSLEDFRVLDNDFLDELKQRYAGVIDSEELERRGVKYNNEYGSHKETIDGGIWHWTDSILGTRFYHRNKTESV